MMDAVKAYLSLRRATGFEMANAECLLDSFAHFAAERKETRIRTQTAIDWAVQGPSLAQRDERLKTVCRFAPSPPRRRRWSRVAADESLRVPQMAPRAVHLLRE